MDALCLKISVVICTYNRATYLPDALHSLYQQTLATRNFEVIVVNNNSLDNTKEVCEQFIQEHTDAFFYYMEEQQQGSSFARNRGAKYAKAPLLCFMDDDAIAETTYLERIVNFFEAYPNTVGLGGRIIPKYIPEEPRWMSHYVSALVGNFDYSNQIEIFKKGKYPLESNMIIRTEDFHKVNGFSATQPGVIGTLRIGGEGKEFFYKLLHLGSIIYYDPSICVQHIVETKKLTRAYMYNVASGIGRGERLRILSMGRFAYLKKIIEYLFKLVASVILGICYTLKGAPEKAMPVIRFRIDVLRGLFNR